MAALAFDPLQDAPQQSGEGLFDSDSRAAAIAGALPLLATYFVAGETWTLKPQPTLLAGEDDVDRAVARAVRLRVILALAEDLGTILQAIIEQPSFRYGRRSDESVGVVAGRLDVSSYLRSRGQITAPRRYPIKIVERQLATPENILASGALHALADALDAVPVDVLPRSGGPERRVIEERRVALLRTTQLPLFARLGPLGRDLARRGHLLRQRDVVVRRLKRREVAQPSAYEPLVDWVNHFAAGAAAIPGDASWSFYDERFDARLFEIWTLGGLTAALTARFGPPVEGRVRELWLRDGEPRGTWETTYGRIEVHFQRDAASLGLNPRWGIRSRDHLLGAVPDITVRMTGTGSNPWVILDCKLQRRRPLPVDAGEPLDLPSDEVYKILGYFEHLGPVPHPVGTLVYYTPGAARTALLERSKDSDEPAIDGTMLLAGVDPAVADANRPAFEKIVDLIGRQLGEPSKEIREEAEKLAAEVIASGGDAVEAEARKQARLFYEVLIAWAEQHPVQRETVESMTRASYRAEDWESLDDETRRMLVSAEVYAVHLPEGMDHSGPVLVLCAACERELNLRFFAPLAATRPAPQAGESQLIPAHPTLGQALFLLRHGIDLATAQEKGQNSKVEKIVASASTTDEAEAWNAVAERLLAEAPDLGRAAKLIEHLSTLNKRYRRVAAHDAAVEREAWVLGRGLILGPDQIVAEIAHVLPPSEVAADRA